MHCQNQEVSSRNIYELKDLEKRCHYPPRFRYKFTCMDRKVAQEVTEVIVTLQGTCINKIILFDFISLNFYYTGSTVNFSYSISLKRPNLLSPEEEDDLSSQRQLRKLNLIDLKHEKYYVYVLDLDSLLLGCL